MQTKMTTMTFVPFSRIPYTFINMIVKNPSQQQWTMVVDGSVLYAKQVVCAGGTYAIEFSQSVNK